MKIRFLQVTASWSPSYPFAVGQIIDVPALTDEHRQWIAEGRAALLEEPPPELAMMGPPAETATLKRGRGRGRR